MTSSKILDGNDETTNTITAIVSSEIEMYQDIINRIESELALLPEGKLTLKRINGNDYFYQITKDGKGIKTHKYLSRKENDFISAVKRRYFIQRSLKQLYNNIDAMNIFLKKYHPYDADEVASELPEVYQNPPTMYSQEKSNCAQSWENQPYKKNEDFPEGLKNSTTSGRKVRSKSEAIISTMLENKNIPFRYEAELNIDDHNYYPDFTIMRPRDGEIIYWEHFGMINNLQYSLAMEQKLITYTRHGLIPWDNLIITFDNKNGSIDAQTIQRIVEIFIA